MPTATPMPVKLSEKAEDIREILRQEQEHLIDLATALGEDPPDLSRHSLLAAHTTDQMSRSFLVAAGYTGGNSEAVEGDLNRVLVSS